MCSAAYNNDHLLVHSCAQEMLAGAWLAGLSVQDVTSLKSRCEPGEVFIRRLWGKKIYFQDHSCFQNSVSPLWFGDREPCFLAGCPLEAGDSQLLLRGGPQFPLML